MRGASCSGREISRYDVYTRVGEEEPMENRGARDLNSETFDAKTVRTSAVTATLGRLAIGFSRSETISISSAL